MAFRTAALSVLTLVAADQCKVKHNTSYSNCWGDDLHGERADSFETCCQRCAEIPRCEVFTFDDWNISGHAEPYCFFKYGCSEPRHSETAVSGILDRPETTPKAPKTTRAPTTRAPTTAPVTTEAPASSTTTPAADLPQCTAPSPVAGVGLAKAKKQLNVSSWEDCCSSCAAPACSYVAFGKYSDVSQETWACFHLAEPADASGAALRASREALTLRDDEATCEDLGLEGCVASPVSMSPGPLPGPPASTSPAALGAVGAGVFLVTIPIGYFVSKRLALGHK